MKNLILSSVIMKQGKKNEPNSIIFLALTGQINGRRDRQTNCYHFFSLYLQ